MLTYPERRRNASPCWYWLATEDYGGLVIVRLSSDVNVIHTWKLQRHPACTVRIQYSVGPQPCTYMYLVPQRNWSTSSKLTFPNPRLTYTHSFGSGGTLNHLHTIITMHGDKDQSDALPFGNDGWESTSWESSVGTTQMDESCPQSGKRHILFIRPIVSDDGVTRAAEVKSNSGTMIRQVAKIALLKENAAWKMVYIRSRGWEQTRSGQCFAL